MYIGIDMGGTHIDGVILTKDSILRRVKNPVDRSNYYETINNCLKELVRDINTDEIKGINLSTTISTNAIVEGKTTPVTLITQEGPGIRRKYDLADEAYIIDGYVDHRGIMVRDLNFSEIRKLPVNKNNNLAIVTKFSTRNPTHENALYDYYKDTYRQISLGHKLSGRLNFPRRVNTAILNSAVYDRYQIFGENIKKTLNELNITAPVYILKADGGTMTLDQAEERPVETILSGPAASFMGMWALTDFSKDSILLDIGGTTTDIFFIVDASPVFEPEGITIKDHKTLVRAIYSESIGIGGDSLVQVVDNSIQVGPTRAGKPIVFGGSEPTLTDALAIIEGSGDLARPTFDKLAAETSLSIYDFSKAVVDIAVSSIYEKASDILNRLNNQPVQTIKEVLEDKQIKPMALKVIGGPAKILEEYLGEKFNLPVEIPENFEVANAIGAAISRPTFEVNILADTKRGVLSVPERNIYQKISRYSLEEATKLAYELLGEDKDLVEITQASEFNMVDGGSFGKNIRVHAQIKPGIKEGLGGINYES